MTYTVEQKPSLWSSKYVIENLPPWIYSDSEEPKCPSECKAKISALQYTIKDIELQIQIRDLELKTGSSRHQSNFDFEKWKAQALRAKQTHMYMLNAFTYWLILNEKDEAESQDFKLNRVIQLLVEEPKDFVQELEKLL
tara:strand:- start:85 stop:501 length:417 start_codon:yes stop_codon:yes gene_type:complete